MADIGFGGGDKASDEPVGLPLKRSSRRSGKRWGAEVLDPSTATPSGVQALVENEGQAAATAPDQGHGDDQPAQKSRKPRHKRWGPDKDAPDPAAPTEDPAPMAGSPAERAGSVVPQKPKRKRWGPDAPTPEPEQEPTPTQEEQSAKGRRKRWGPDESQAPADEPAQQPGAQADASEDVVPAGKASKKRRWGPEEAAAQGIADSLAAMQAPAEVDSAPLL